MRGLINILNRFIPKQTVKPLGRWQLDYCSKKIDIKIDLANEDHCGPCKMPNWDANECSVQNPTIILNVKRSVIPQEPL